jgi:hypothetical protein
MGWVRDARHQGGGRHAALEGDGGTAPGNKWATAAGVSESAALVRQATCAPESAEACRGVAIVALCLMGSG